MSVALTKTVYLSLGVYYNISLISASNPISINLSASSKTSTSILNIEIINYLDKSILNEFFIKSTILPGVAIIISGYLLNSASYY